MDALSLYSSEFFIYTIILGLFIGCVTSILGIGGGIFMVPLLPSLFKIPVHEAVATSLFTIFLVTLLNTVLFHQQKAVKWSVGLWLGIPAAVVAFFIPRWAVRVPEVAVQAVLIVVMLIMALVTYLNRKSLSEQSVNTMGRSSRIQCLSAGAIVGALSGFSGLGGGLFFGPFLIYRKLVYARELTPTMNLTAMLTTTLGSLGYLVLSLSGQNYIHFNISFVLFLVSGLSGIYFKKLQVKLPVQWKAMAIVFVLIAMSSKVGLSLIGKM